jgi:hypothetical protein
MKARTHHYLLALVSSVSLNAAVQEGGAASPAEKGFTKPAPAAEQGFKKPSTAEKPGAAAPAGEKDGGFKKPAGEGDAGNKKPGMREGVGSKKKGEGDRGSAKPGMRDGDGKKPGGGEGDSGKKKMGPRDGEGKKTSAETGMKKGSGEGGFKKPGAEGMKKAPGTPAETLLIRVLDKGATVDVAGEKVERNQLRAHLSSFLPEHSGAIVIVEGTADVPFGEMSGVLDAVRDNGAKKAQMRVAE